MIHEEIPPALGGERLDRIVALVTDASRADAAALVAAGGVMVDGRLVTSGKQRLQVGQHIDVDETKLPIIELPQADRSIAFGVIYEDDHVIVVDKPGGLVVHPGAGNMNGTLVNGLLARYPDIATVGDPHRPGIVHRLDVGTSGLMVVARSIHAYHSLVYALSQRDVARVYRTMVWGVLANPTGVIDAPIGRDHRDPMRMSVVVDGKSARTRYQVLDAYSKPVEASALECRLESGRTHQIRVHLAAIGHPVIGDLTYGSNRAQIAAGRPFLHAAELAFVHPATNEQLAFHSPLPDDLAVIEAQFTT
ncbi:MAG TPA: RluA family pseudouridine synthase [Ilumatobacteraceae bacterium]|nr:RluA family pseudouridine synthase [Ilumatobacteraceae bacterium]